MPLRKAKEPARKYYETTAQWESTTRELDMIRRVEALYEEFSRLPAIAFITVDDPYEPIKRCHAAICEIAGVEMEEQI